MRHFNSWVTGVGLALGDEQTAEEAVALGLCDADWAERSQQIAVRVAPEDRPAPQLAADAAEMAMVMAAADPDNVGPVSYHYVLHGGVDAHNPAAYVQNEVGIAGGPFPITATSDGCHGALNGMIAAASYLVQQDCPRDLALVVGADRWDRGFDRWGAGYDAPFGDGAGAVVLSRVPGGPLTMVSSATFSDPSLEPLYRGDAPWGLGHIGDGAPLDLGARIRASIPDEETRLDVHHRMGLVVAEAARAALKDAGLDMEDPRHIVVPFGRRRVLERNYQAWLACRWRQLETTAAFGHRVGHLGAGDPLVGLAHLLNEHAIRPGQTVLLLSDGGGFSATAVVLRMTGPVAE
jgi:3-oxoacyl-[acyl-carrier-protein] synthase-3